MNPRIPHHTLVMVPRVSIIPESKISIAVLCLPYHTAVQIKDCSKSMSVIAIKHMMPDGAARPSYRLKLKYPLPFPVSYV